MLKILDSEGFLKGKEGKTKLALVPDGEQVVFSYNEQQ